MSSLRIIGNSIGTGFRVLDENNNVIDDVISIEFTPVIDCDTLNCVTIKVLVKKMEISTGSNFESEYKCDKIVEHVDISQGVLEKYKI